jgi:hypothetical protein
MRKCKNNSHQRAWNRHMAWTGTQTKNSMKPHKAKALVNWSQLHVTHSAHDMNKKHSCSTNYNILM